VICCQKPNFPALCASSWGQLSIKIWSSAFSVSFNVAEPAHFAAKCHQIGGCQPQNKAARPLGAVSRITSVTANLVKAHRCGSRFFSPVSFSHRRPSFLPKADTNLHSQALFFPEITDVLKNSICNKSGTNVKLSKFI